MGPEFYKLTYSKKIWRASALEFFLRRKPLWGPMGGPPLGAEGYFMCSTLYDISIRFLSYHIWFFHLFFKSLGKQVSFSGPICTFVYFQWFQVDVFAHLLISQTKTFTNNMIVIEFLTVVQKIELKMNNRVHLCGQ